MRRRKFLGGMTAGLVGGMAMAAPIPQGRTWRRLPRRKAGVEVRNTARNLIFVLLDGGPSHVDMFDLKQGPETPDFLGAQDMGGYLWPSGIMPQLASLTDHFSLVRAMSAVEAVHERAVYHLLTAHRPNAALTSEIPQFSAMLSYKLDGQRKPGDTLPVTMVVNSDGAFNGFLPIEHRGLGIGEDGSIENLEHYFENADARFSLLDSMTREVGAVQDRRGDLLTFQAKARTMMADGELKTLLQPPKDGGEGDYSIAGQFLGQCQTAVRVLSADKGIRVFQMFLGGWDHHVNIYDQNGEEGLPGLANALDSGLAYLINELAGRPAAGGTGSMLDETLIVAVGEFGRTTGRLNTSAGRDHFPYVVPALVAGGGIKPGRVIGATSSDGSNITDPGWSRNRYITVNDLMATIYSAMGVDWTERFEDTPSGRVFEIVDPTLVGQIYEIDPLFV